MSMNAYTVLIQYIKIVDDEGVLNFKDVEWCKENLQETIHVPETQPAEPEEMDKESIEQSRHGPIRRLSLSLVDCVTNLSMDFK